MSSVNRRVPSENSALWQRLTVKAAVALAVLLSIRVLFAQQPVAVPAGGFAAEAQTDAKGYKYLLPHKKLWEGKDAKKEADDARKKASEVRAGTRPLAENASLFNAFYTLYWFPLMTHTTEDRLKRLADDRVLFLRELETCKANDARNALIALTLVEMTKIVRDAQFHPAVRYNAMWIISNLNDVEPVRSLSGAVFPVPMVRALPIIYAEFKREENPDSIKMAALLGLSRHLEWENEKVANQPAMPADQRTQIMKDLLALAQANDAPSGRDEEGHIWMRRRAIEALGLACLKKPDAEVADAFVALLKDPEQPISVRCSIAGTLGRTTLPRDKFDITALAKELGYLALVASDAELTRVTKLNKDDIEHAIRLTGQFPSDVLGAQMPASPRAGLVPGGGMSSGGYSGGDGGGGGYGAGGYGRPPAASYGTAGTGDGGGGYGGMDPSMQDPKGYRLDASRRRLRYDLYCIQLGLTGAEDRSVAKTAPTPITKTAGATRPDPTRGVWPLAKAGPERDTVDKVYAAVKDVIAVVEKSSAESLALTIATSPPPLTGPPLQPLDKLDKDVRRVMKNLEGAVGRKLAAPGATSAPAATASADDLPGARPAVGAGKGAGAGKTALAGTPAPAGKAPPAPAPGAKAPPANARPAPAAKQAAP